MTAIRLHHVGLVVADDDAVSDRYCELLGLHECRSGVDDKLQVRWRWLTNDEELFIELLSPVGDGAVRKYLRERGEGLHHLSFEPADFERCLDRFRFVGTRVIGLDRHHDGWQELFLDPALMGGALIQLARERSD